MFAAIRARLEDDFRILLVLIIGRHVPWIARLVIAFGIYYLYAPIDLIPNDIPVFGYADDAAVIWACWKLTKHLIPSEIYNRDTSRLLPVNWSVKDTTNEVWVLADNRIGNTNQSLGLAEQLGLPIRVINIGYTRLIKLPNFLREVSLIGLDKDSICRLHAPWPKIVISAGRRLSPALRFIKMASGNRTRIIQIMNPEAGYKDFDLIVVPNHDRNLKRTDNVLRVTGAPNRVTDARLNSEIERWLPMIAHLPRPWIAVLMGGNARHFDFDEAKVMELARMASKAATECGGSLLITTSRRTDEKITNAFCENLSAPSYFHVWSQAALSPIMGFLGLADFIVVTGDSMSMCSEACASGKPVYIYAPSESGISKYGRLHHELYEKQLAKPFEGHLQSNWQGSAKNPTEEIAVVAKKLFNM